MRARRRTCGSSSTIRRPYQVGANPYADVGAQQLDVNGEYSIGYNDFVQQMKWTGTIDWIKPQ